MDKKKLLFVDIETYSSVDITKAGSYKYIESPDFEILMVQYAWDDGPVRVLDFASAGVAGLPEDERNAWCDIDRALTDPEIVKVAHNCDGFERQAFRRHLNCYMPPEQWVDTMSLCAMNGLPMSLDAAGAALNISLQKLKEGTTLISYFCKPCKPTIANKGRTRNLPEHAPDKWERFKAYGLRDVEAMQQIYYRLRDFPVPAWERDLRCADCRVNEHGVMIDRELVEAAVALDAQAREKNMAELRRLTGLDNPNSVSQLREWLEGVGLGVDSLNKATIAELLQTTPDARICRVLTLRQLLSKTSTKKYETMLTAASDTDDRIRGMMQYYGAGRTGRWAGRLVQPQNLVQNHLEDIGTVRELVRARDLDALELLFDSVPDVLSQLIRTALVARPGCTFLVADYSAIEARVIAYLAGVKWRQDVFRNGGDIYCSSASQMFKVPVEKHGVNKHLRQKGKIAELACGYGGGVAALKAFGADKMGLTDPEMKEIVDQWRAASPEIPRFWREAEQAAKNALRAPGRTFSLACGCKYRRDRDALRLRLPSGRVLSYWGAYLDADGAIHFQAQNQTTRKWEDTETWGGKLVENIVQAYARDCLAVAMLRLEAAGYQICFSVHDELICEEPKDGRTWQDMAEIMGQPIDWAPGLLLRADGYATDYYLKD